MVGNYICSWVAWQSILVATSKTPVDGAKLTLSYIFYRKLLLVSTPPTLRSCSDEYCNPSAHFSINLYHASLTEIGKSISFGVTMRLASEKSLLPEYLLADLMQVRLARCFLMQGRRKWRGSYGS
jgi:hypothetical protein